MYDQNLLDRILRNDPTLKSVPDQELLQLIDGLEAYGEYIACDAVYKHLAVHAKEEMTRVEVRIMELDKIRRAAQYQVAYEGFKELGEIGEWPARIRGRLYQAYGQVLYNLPGRIDDALEVQRKLLAMPDLGELPLNRQLLARESHLAALIRARRFGDDFSAVVKDSYSFLNNQRDALHALHMWERGLGGIINALGQAKRAQKRYQEAAGLMYAFHLITPELRGRVVACLFFLYCMHKGRRWDDPRVPLLGIFFQELEGALQETERVGACKVEYEFCKKMFPLVK